MGNYGSCLNPHNGVDSKIAKLVDSQGQVTPIELPTTVAELMLENPGFAICPVDEVVRSRRVLVMKADDVLEGRKYYLLVPVDKVNSRMSDSQLAAIDSLLCKRKVKGGRTRGSSKVSPFVEGGENLESLVRGLSEKCTGLAGQKSIVSKAWVPVLEPIMEVW
ncbi:hypothetical protein RND81_07G011500 [Saponaria officinalis]|uniref:Uncharacterized protein n=1 Tax=Saponaria officinalis TaxID=3572 RepID=A0AAW1JLW6_SAPOF